MSDERKKAIEQIGKLMPKRYVPPPDNRTDATASVVHRETNDIMRRAAESRYGPISGRLQVMRDRWGKQVLEARAEVVRATATVTQGLTHLTFDQMALTSALVQYAAQRITLGEELHDAVAQRLHVLGISAEQRALEMEDAKRLALEARQFHEARQLTFQRNLQLTAARKDTILAEARSDLADAQRDHAGTKTPAAGAAPQTAPADLLTQLRNAYAAALAAGNHAEATRLQQAINAYVTPMEVPKTGT